MNLTRLSELLDLADNAALTPAQARELADEQAKLAVATAWTAAAPSRPGLYAWRASANKAAVLIRVIEHPTGRLATYADDADEWRGIAEMGGVWSAPIAPAREEAR
jgi:hypothetical protein